MLYKQGTMVARVGDVYHLYPLLPRLTEENQTNHFSVKHFISSLKSYTILSTIKQHNLSHCEKAGVQTPLKNIEKG
jgi:hypothetical protein